MWNCILGSATKFGGHHSAQVCSRCGAVNVFLDAKLCAAFNEDGDELQVLTCAGSMRNSPFTISLNAPDTLQVCRGGTPVFQIVERGEALEKMSPV